MTDAARPFPAVATDDYFALTALRIVFFTGFALVATLAGFIFLAPAGFVLAMVIAVKGFRGPIWRQSDFALKVLAIIAFAVFATLATVLGFVFLAPAGFVLALIFAFRGFSVLGGSSPVCARDERSEPSLQPTGNQAFDAYRAQMLRRLEEEREHFCNFLQRLRDAKDKAEFDEFMDDRARKVRDGDADAGPARLED